MGQLKRIFGQCDPEAEKRVEQDLEQIESGQVTQIYPIFKPGNWFGTKTGAFNQILVGTQEQPELVIALGYDAPNSFVFLMPKDIEDKELNQILKQAYDNLEAVECDFEIFEELNKQVLIATGHKFSSEKILCRNHMLKAHELLQAKELLVSIPRRSCMMVTSKQADEELLNTVIYLHNRAWEDDSIGNPPILNALFIVIDGRIDGIFPIDKK